MDEEDEKRKCIEFKDELINFHKKHLLNENFKVPSIGGKELDLCKLYKAVYVRGGSVQVSSKKVVEGNSQRIPNPKLVHFRQFYSEESLQPLPVGLRK